MALNNYTKSYTNIMFLVENDKMVLDLNSKENGTYERTEILFDKDGKKVGEVPATEHSSIYNIRLKIVPVITHTTIDSLLSTIMGLKFNKENFINYYNRYIVPHSRDTGININDFPLTIDNLLKLCDIDSSMYDIDAIIKNLLTFDHTVEDEIFDIVVEENVKTKMELDTNLLNSILSIYNDKLVEYKNGKTNLLNMFFGEYLKKLSDKSIDKKELINNIKVYLDKV